jgi:hypothetical protein
MVASFKGDVWSHMVDLIDQDLIHKNISAIRHEIVNNIELARTNMQAIVESCFEPVEAREELRAGLVDEIKVQGIRSFGPPVSVRLSPSLSLIYASNGMGKTSLVDALELLTEGATSRGWAHPNAMSEVKDEDHIPHKNENGVVSDEHSPRVSVKWKLVDSDLPLETAWSGDYGHAAEKAPDIQLLARRKLRQLVNSRPTQRIELLGASLGLTETNRFWAAVSEGLKEPWFAETSTTTVAPGADVLVNEAPDLTDALSLENWLREWAEKERDEIPSLPEQWTIPASQMSPDEWESLASDLEKHEQNSFPSVPEREHERISFYQSLLKIGHPDETCPACESAEITSERFDNINAIIDEYKTRITHMENRKRLEERAELLWQQLQRTPGDWEVQPFESGTDDNLAKLRSETKKWRLLKETLHSLRTVKPGHRTPEKIREVAECLTSLESVKNDIEVAIVQHQQTSYSDEEMTRWRQKELLVRKVESGTREVAENILDFRKWEELNELSQHASQQVRKRIKSHSEAVVADLSDSINDWLVALAPAGTPAIKLMVQGSSGGPKLAISLHKSKKTLHALGHLSDAQLDMLGMAAHFARIERDHKDALVVIDDPSDMLDSQTRHQFVNTGLRKLLKKPDGTTRQVVILTHDDQLVRELWDAYRELEPSLTQDSIQMQNVEDNPSLTSVFVPRDLTGALRQVEALLKSDLQEHQNRLWFRAALAAQTRVSLEMYAKQIGTILGPVGLARIESLKENETLGKVANTVTSELQQLEASACQAPHHIGPKKDVAQILDLLSASGYRELNPGAHADIVLPEVSASRNLIDALSDEVKKLQSAVGQTRAEWVSTSRLAEALNQLASCTNPCEAPG